MLSKINKTTLENELIDFPSVEDGIRGMAFIENVVASSESEKSGRSITSNNNFVNVAGVRIDKV
ncbi:MAG: hypothetical protein WKF59_22915 [Chitinophagaceae bacterium]